MIVSHVYEGRVLNLEIQNSFKTFFQNSLRFVGVLVKDFFILMKDPNPETSKIYLRNHSVPRNVLTIKIYTIEDFQVWNCHENYAFLRFYPSFTPFQLAQIEL